MAPLMSKTKRLKTKIISICNKSSQLTFPIRTEWKTSIIRSQRRFSKYTIATAKAPTKRFSTRRLAEIQITQASLWRPMTIWTKWARLRQTWSQQFKMARLQLRGLFSSWKTTFSTACRNQVSQKNTPCHSRGPHLTNSPAITSTARQSLRHSSVMLTRKCLRARQVRLLQTQCR